MWQIPFYHRGPIYRTVFEIREIFQQFIPSLRGRYAETKTKLMFETKTKTFIFVLEAPRDQDPDLEDYITALNISETTRDRAIVTYI